MPFVSILLFRLALLAHPRWLRERYRDDMTAAFCAAALERRRRGRWAVATYTLRAVADVARSGWKERPKGRVEMGEWWMDVRVAVRSLRKTPWFTAAAMLVLALGIGANAAIFSALKATLLTPPPYPHPERLVFLNHTRMSHGRLLPGPYPWSYPEYRTLAAAPGVRNAGRRRKYDPLRQRISRQEVKGFNRILASCDPAIRRSEIRYAARMRD